MTTAVHTAWETLSCGRVSCGTPTERCVAAVGDRYDVVVVGQRRRPNRLTEPERPTGCLMLRTALRTVLTATAILLFGLTGPTLTGCADSPNNAVVEGEAEGTDEATRTSSGAEIDAAIADGEVDVDIVATDEPAEGGSLESGSGMGSPVLIEAGSN